MTKAFFILAGLVLVALGAWGAVAWTGAVVMVLEATAVIVAIFVGLVMIAFTVSELRSPAPPLGTSAAATSPPEETP